MMIYLDAASNRRTHPNENYARELMELFCLGVGRYTEADVQQLARCFTGLELQNGAVGFISHWHDPGVKKLLGAEGPFNDKQAVELVLSQDACPRFLARKLVRGLVCDDADLPDALLEPVARRLRESGMAIRPAVEMILRSRLFFSDAVIGRKVRGPVELAIGLLRTLEARTSTTRLADDLRQLGQALFDPPSVKGWDGGLAWINTGALLGRANLVRDLLQRKETRLASGGPDDWLGPHAAGPAASVDFLLELLVAVPPPPAVREDLVALASARGRQSRPVTAAVLQAIGALPEFHLA
jgi:uncharacterized protein (DUF1800 family)